MAGRPLTNVGSNTAAFGPSEWALMLTLGLIWGSAFLWIAIAVDHLAPGPVAWGRTALGAAALALFPAARRKIDRADWGRLAAIALIGNAAPVLLFAIAETELDSAVAGMLTSGSPLFSLLVASLMLRSIPGKTQVIGIGIGFAGIVLMTIPSLQGAEAAPLGVSLVLLAVVCYGVNGNLVVPLQQRYGGPAVAMWALMVSSVALLPIGVTGLSESEFVWSSIVALLILGVVGTGFARSLSATLAGRAGAPRMATSSYLIPIIALALGALFRDEIVHPIAIAGVAVALAGAWIATRAIRVSR
ncbi:MAG: DMT family transporter [Acidimicrobiia bacterium]|nr:DMT family transporter [Acidimicrobiia bacterium]